MLCTLSTSLRKYIFLSFCHVIFCPFIFSFLYVKINISNFISQFIWTFYSEISNMPRVWFDFTLSVMAINRIFFSRVSVLSWEFIKSMMFLWNQMATSLFLTSRLSWHYECIEYPKLCHPENALLSQFLLPLPLFSKDISWGLDSPKGNIPWFMFLQSSSSCFLGGLDSE